jgi:hypothetical protein
MDTMTNYEFNVQVWEEDGVWNYSVVQEFESQGSSEVEPIEYGTAESPEEAFAAAAQAVREFFG